MQQKGNPMMMQQMAMMQQKGGMPGMPQMGMMQNPMMQKGGMPQPQAAPPQQGGSGINTSALAAAPPAVQKQMIGEKLYPLVAKINPELAGRVTGMMLEMETSELLMLLESEQQMRSKVLEAMQVLQK